MVLECDGPPVGFAFGDRAGLKPVIPGFQLISELLPGDVGDEGNDCN